MSVSFSKLLFYIHLCPTISYLYKNKGYKTKQNFISIKHALVCQAPNIGVSEAWVEIRKF